MNLRRVQETGGTFFVSLPHHWAQQNGVEKGSLVSATESENGQLVIDPKYELKKKVEIAELEPSLYLKREITGKYLLGYDIIKISNRNRLPPEVAEKVREVIRGLIGLEIIEEDTNRISLNFFWNPLYLHRKRFFKENIFSQLACIRMLLQHSLKKILVSLRLY